METFMKKTLFAVLTLISSHVFSQSYLILTNGVTLTTDKAGFIYDFGHFHLPYKVNAGGGQYFFDSKKLITVDSMGFLYEKSLKIDSLRGKGINYFVDEDDKLITIDSQGFFYQFESKDKIFKKIIGYGGNFFLVKPEDNKTKVDLYTVNEKGNYFKTEVTGLNPNEITEFGGQYFQTKSNLTYTVSKEGFVYNKAGLNIGGIVQKGGNYFIDTFGILYTVSDSGFLMLPSLPVQLNLKTIKKMGANYMIDEDGRIFVVSSDGQVNERQTTHDLRNTKILSL
jgi:hypothetical protein